MGLDLNKIFLPSVGVDIVFNMNSLAPYSRASIIYDVDHANNEITVAQTLSPFSNHTEFTELHLTTIIQDKNRRIRVGVECTHFNVIDHYELASKAAVPAVAIRYELPAKETNIRSAFRLPLSMKYIIKGKLLYRDLEYFTPRDFSIRDISLTGLGLVIPKKRHTSLNPLAKIKINEQLVIGIILINMEQNEPVGTLPIKAQVMRMNSAYSETHVLMGLKILNLTRDGDATLNKFIHDAQIDELKRLSRRDL